MTEPVSMDQLLTIRLSLAELVVLSDCLDRLSRQGSVSAFIDKAEQIALWSLDSELERNNPVVVSPDYAKYLEQAKSYVTRGVDE